MERVRAYDPRDPEQVLADPSTWKETENRALITASKKPERGEDHWRGVAMLAEMWDIGIREDATMAANAKHIAKLSELAARALCRRAGNPENTMFEGKPMWTSYLGEVATVFKAIDLEGLVDGGKTPPPSD